MVNDLVSILIPVYNRAGLIGETVASALEQTHSPIEVIVVDNASTDGTWELLQQLASGNSRLRIFRNERNIGPVKNWIACTRHACGTFAKILWSDDLMEPTYIERCLPLLRNPSVGFVYSAVRMFEDQVDRTTPHTRVAYDQLPTGLYPSSLYINGIIVGERFPVSPGCAIFRTADLKRNLWPQVPNSIGSDFSNHAIGNDLLLFLLTAESYPNFAVVGEPLSWFREHSGSITSQVRGEQITLHYDVVRAYFVQRFAPATALQARLNALLWLHCRRYPANPFGIRNVRDFYSDKAPARSTPGLAFLAFFLIRKVTDRIRQKLAANA